MRRDTSWPRLDAFVSVSQRTFQRFCVYVIHAYIGSFGFVLLACEDGCVNVLLDEVEQMIKQVTSVQLDGNRIPLPWPTLDRVSLDGMVNGEQLKVLDNQ